MATEKFIEIQGLQNDIENRKHEAIGNEQKLKQELIQCEMSYDLAALNNQPTDELSLKCEDLKRKVDRAGKAVRALDKSPGAIANFLKGNTSIASLAKEIKTDNMAQIEGFQKDYEAKSLTLEEIKAQYLSTVAAMGSISQEAQELANEINNVKKFIPGFENQFFQGIPEQINNQREGSIYISTREIEKIYKNGVTA